MSNQASTVHTSSGEDAFGFFRNLRIGTKIIAGYLLLIVLIGGVSRRGYKSL